MAPLLEHTLSDWQRVVDVNLTGSFLTAREAARVMVARGSGSIINVSSVFAMGATKRFPVISYYAAKGGVEGLTKGLAVELGDSNVRVNAIAPGFFPSPMSSGHVQRETSPVRRSGARCWCRGRRCPRCRAARICAAPSGTSRATSRPSSPGIPWSSTVAGVPSSARA